MTKKMQNYLNSIQWKQVVLPSGPTPYYVSSIGQLLNKKTGNVIKGSPTVEGYIRVTISANGDNKATLLHRLVAQAFIPNPEDKPEVNHKDGNKQNNCVENLEWVTSKENTAHAIAMGLKWYFGQKCRGSTNGRAIYSEAQIKEACELMMNPEMRPIMIERLTGVSRITQTHLKLGKEWTHITKDYAFPNVDFIHGTNNVNNKYTEEQIHQVCQLLETGKKNLAEIARECGVDKNLINHILAGNTWRDIASMYEIKSIDHSTGENHGSAIYTAQQIREVCQMLEDNKYPITVIEKITGVGLHTISKISKKLSWKSISKDYNIPDAIVSGHKPTNRTERILELFKQGKTNIEITAIIQDEFNMERRKAQLSVSDVKSRFLRDSGSSTIDQLRSSGEIPRTSQ